MRIRNILLVLALAVVAVLSSGCAYSTVKSFQGSWEIDFSKQSDAFSALNSFTLIIDKNLAFVDYELTEECEEFGPPEGFEPGYYNVTYFTDGSSAVCYLDQGINYYTDVVLGKDELSVRVHYKLVGKQSRSDNLYLKRSGTATMPSEPFEPDIKPNPTPNPTPDPEPGDSDFGAIKSAYASAGYNVDLASDENLDASVQQLVSTMQAQYGQLGYDLCFIGKDFDNLLNAEMYMLIATKTESEAEELEQGFGGAYQTQRRGRDLIVYIWTLGSPNFDIFNQTAQ